MNRLSPLFGASLELNRHQSSDVTAEETNATPSPDRPPVTTRTAAGRFSSRASAMLVGTATIPMVLARAYHIGLCRNVAVVMLPVTCQLTAPALMSLPRLALTLALVWAGSN